MVKSRRTAMTRSYTARLDNRLPALHCRSNHERGRGRSERGARADSPWRPSTEGSEYAWPIRDSVADLRCTGRGVESIARRYLGRTAFVRTSPYEYVKLFILAFPFWNLCRVPQAAVSSSEPKGRNVGFALLVLYRARFWILAFGFYAEFGLTDTTHSTSNKGKVGGGYLHLYNYYKAS